MSRRHRAEKREILPDPLFGDMVLNKFMNNVMLDSKKSVAEKIVYGALERLSNQKGDNDNELDQELASKNMGLARFHKALGNVGPQVEVRSRRVGGATYQVPVEVKADRRQALSMRMIINAARKRNEKTMEERLYGELNDALNERGAAVKKRDEIHKMAEANRAFAHYKW